MTRTRLAALALLPALALPACVTTSYRTTEWGDPSGQTWERWGRVERIREVVRRTEGNPAGGAVAGAIIGGLLGNAWSRGSGAGTMVGAAGGAMMGAAASQGAAEDRRYEVLVRFDDGATAVYAYEGASPFEIGDVVRLTPQGLYRG